MIQTSEDLISERVPDKEFIMTNFTDPMVNILGTWIADVTVWSILLRLALSFAISAVIGCERASKRHSAGLRTFIVISLSTTLVAIIDKVALSGWFPVLSAAAVIAGALITVNSILYSSKNQIKGLTTAAALWGVGIVGLAIGVGMYTVSLIFVLALILCLSALGGLERFLKNRSNYFEIHLELDKSSDLQNFVAVSRKLGLKIDDVEINPAYVNSGLSVYTVSLSVVSPELKKYKTHKEIIEAISSIDYVSFVEEIGG